jgi:hypothetical protein
MLIGVKCETETDKRKKKKSCAENKKQRQEFQHSCLSKRTYRTKAYYESEAFSSFLSFHAAAGSPTQILVRCCFSIPGKRKQTTKENKSKIKLVQES